MRSSGYFLPTILLVIFTPDDFKSFVLPSNVYTDLDTCIHLTPFVTTAELLWGTLRVSMPVPLLG